MLAPVTFNRVDAKRIAIDAYDVASVSEGSDDLVEITYIPYEKPDSFVTSEGFTAVLEKIAQAKKDSEPKEDGEDWKD